MMAAMPDMKHHDPNAVTVAPGAAASLVWRFTHRGDFEFGLPRAGPLQNSAIASEARWAVE